MQYDRKWFEQRARKVFKRMGENTWDFSDSALLYATSKDVELYEELQDQETDYYRLVTAPERAYLASIAKDVVKQLPDGFDFIDLGPGTAHKEQFLFDELRAQKKDFTYIPVDISEYFLEKAVKHASAQTVSTHGVLSAFEEVREKLEDRRSPRFVSLGLTFSNYHLDDALRLLKGIAGPDGYAFINAHIRERIDAESLVNIYQEDVAAMADERLNLLNLAKDAVSTPQMDEDFRVWATIQKTNTFLDDKGVKIGDRVLVFESLRYSKAQLNEILQQYPGSVLLDTGAPFVGMLIKF